MTAPGMAPIVETCAALLTHGIRDGDCRHRFDLAIRWDPAEPLSIFLDMAPTGGNVEHSWEIGRDLFDLEGDRPGGFEGADILVKPYRSVVMFQLTVPGEGACTFSVPRRAVASVLFRSYAVVPVGAEGDCYDLDLAVQRILVECVDPAGHEALEHGAAQEHRLPPTARKGYCDWCGRRVAGHAWWSR
jgi:hypothetical protein